MDSARFSDSWYSALSYYTKLLIPWLPTQLHRCFQDPAPSTSASKFNTNVHMYIFSLFLWFCQRRLIPHNVWNRILKIKSLEGGNTVELDQARKWALRKWASLQASLCIYQSERTSNWARLGCQLTEHCPFRHRYRSLNGVINTFKQHSWSMLYNTLALQAAPGNKASCSQMSFESHHAEYILREEFYRKKMC